MLYGCGCGSGQSSITTWRSLDVLGSPATLVDCDAEDAAVGVDEVVLLLLPEWLWLCGCELLCIAC